MSALLELFSFPVFMFGAFFVASLFLMLATGNSLIARLKALKGMKWSPREDTPDSHGKKAGVPSMGGIGIIGSALVGYAAVMVFVVLVDSYFSKNNIVNINYTPAVIAYCLLLPAVVGLHALLGFADDLSKARGTGGLSSRAKLLGQILLGAGFFFALLLIFSSLLGNPSVSQTFSQRLLLYLLIIVGTSNAVNLSDGIDGLAAGLSLQCAAAFAFMTFSVGTSFFYLQLGFPAYALWFCLGGACLGFLAFNKHPAKIFMGDTGSLALGTALGAGAIMTRSIWLLPFIGFIFFVEMFSVIFQVAYFKYTKKRFGEGKRIFRRAPLHHHFELAGWSEWRIVSTLWAVNAVTTVVGLFLWKAGVIPRFP